MSNHMKENGATVLSIVASAGVVATAVVSGIAGYKVTTKLNTLYSEKESPTKLDIVKTVTPPFLPTVAIAGGTIFSILSANVINQKKQATITSAYMLCQSQFKEYRNKLIELKGKEADEEVRNAVIKDHYDERANTADNEIKKRFYEPYTDTFFEMTERDLINAEFHFNRCLINDGVISLSEWCALLGFDIRDVKSPLPLEQYGWWISDDWAYCWVDFDHFPCGDDDNGDYIEISYSSEPERDYDNSYFTY